MKKPIFPRGAGAAALIAVLLAMPARSPAATPDQSKLPAGAKIGNYVGEDVMIPMRDGVKLHAEVWRPEGVAAGVPATGAPAAGNLPILVQRSPYGFGMERVTRSFGAEYKELARRKGLFSSSRIFADDSAPRASL